MSETLAALRLAQDALTDAEQYHARACRKDAPHDHALLRKLQFTIPVVEAAIAALETPPVRDTTNPTVEV